jgi:serine/threonine-protein kinase
VTVAFEEGALVGERFRLLHRLGEGGMGQVWAARNIATRRKVALKLLSPRTPLSDNAIKRLKREARLASHIEHPHVIDVLDLLDGAHGPVMVMELLRGETLGELIAREAPLSLERTASLLAQVVSAVGAAHERGIIHRDLKPTNIFITEPDGVVKVLDFGIARIADASDTLHDTATGQLLGTPVYMAPEQHCAEPDIDHRADVWAVGVLIYELLSGKRPLDGRTSGQIMEQLTTAGVPPLRALAPDAPFDLAILARRMLERDRSRRPEDLCSVAACLAEYATVEVPAFGAAHSIEIVDEPDDGTITTAPMELTTRMTKRRSSLRWGLPALALGAATAVWAIRGEPTAEEARDIAPANTATPPSSEPEPPRAISVEDVPSAEATVSVSSAPSPRPSPVMDRAGKPTAVPRRIATPEPEPVEPPVTAAPSGESSPSAATPKVPHAPPPRDPEEPEDGEGLIDEVPF